VLQPSEVLHKKAILVERGSFRPVTHVNVDMINSSTTQFVQEPLVKGREVVVLMEITMNNLLSGGALDVQDFLARVDLLADIGFTVLISNYSEYYRLTSYFRRYTKEMIGVAMGINNLLEPFAATVLITAKKLRIVDHLANLYAHLLESHYIESIVGFDTNILNIFSRDVLKKIKDNDLLWEKMVPSPVADAIRRRGLFGHATNSVVQSRVPEITEIIH